MTILRPNFILILLFFSCNKNKRIESQVNNELKIVFIDTLSNAKLKDFNFGTAYQGEELPMNVILTRNSHLIHKDNGFVSVSNINDNNQILYGYFFKKGYEVKKFIINKKLNYQKVIVRPEPTNISIKAYDNEVSNDIDSLNICFEIKKEDLSKTEFYTFDKKSLTPNLEYFNKNIEVGQSIEVKIKVFKGKEIYEIQKHIEYQPLLNSTIILI